MIVSFQILENRKGNFIPLSNDEAKCVSIGGYSFEIKNTSIPFDWDAFYGAEENKIFNFQTGCGLLFNDYEISDCYDEAYEDIGITREEITAEFLASVSHIEEFFVDFNDNNGYEHDIGWFADNIKNAQYKVKLIEMLFIDMETQNKYPVSQSVLEQYNIGK